MLDHLEDAVIARLETLKTQQPRLMVDSYGGELSDPNLLSGLLTRCPALLVTAPVAKISKKSMARYSLGITLRLIIATCHPRNERATRRGTRPGDLGSYALWQAVMTRLHSFKPWGEGASLSAGDLRNLVNGAYQSNHLSILEQSFSIGKDWEVPEDDAPLLAGIDLGYYTPPDADTPAARDTINTIQEGTSDES